MDAWHQDARATIYHGDCLTVLAKLPDASVDAVVTDPPYELGFMGKGWDASGIAYRVDLWAEALRVLKPGGHLLAFGGTRTWHRLACAIEDAGFEVRDSIAWMYGSGFPKSLDVSKAIDKAAGAERERIGDYGQGFRAAGSGLEGWQRQAHSIDKGITAPATDAAREWSGWGTALKPAHEPIVVARKPLVGTVAANVLEHGTGALNIDACRIAHSGSENMAAIQAPSSSTFSAAASDWTTMTYKPGGRWPANVVLDEDQAAELDQQSGNRPGGTYPAAHQIKSQPGQANGTMNGGWNGVTRTEAVKLDDSGGASRFFYVAKAPARERPKVDGTAHPTVKPLTLMRWLCRLVTPPNGVILEPFAGSGTTVEAALLEGFRVVAIEREADYLPLIQARLDRVTTAEPTDEQLTLDASA